VATVGIRVRIAETWQVMAETQQAIYRKFSLSLEAIVNRMKILMSNVISAKTMCKNYRQCGYYTLECTATTLKDTFAEHLGIKCTERENPSLGYLETAYIQTL